MPVHPVQSLGLRPARPFELEPTRGDVRRVRRGQCHGFGADQRRQPARGRGRVAGFRPPGRSLDLRRGARTNAGVNYAVQASDGPLAAGVNAVLGNLPTLGELW